MANPSAPYVGIWRLFIDECHTKSNDFYEIDDINTFGVGALYQIARRYMQKMGMSKTKKMAFPSGRLQQHREWWPKPTLDPAEQFFSQMRLEFMEL